MTNRACLLAAPILAVALAAPAGAKEYSHQQYFEHYEGTRTCLSCHEKEATTFFHSQHYQWKAPAAKLVNARGMQLGKINMINDYCTNPVPNWIGKVSNERGDVLAAGCSKCHAGLGKLPSEKISREQLENIDCLICHASGYQRDVYQNADGSWEWRPVLWKNREGLDSVSKRIGAPTRTTCLRCHAGSGGGPNFKRGDIEYVLANPPRDYDVHMATEGTNLQCVDCHAGAEHKIPGGGTDLAGTEVPETMNGCDSKACHGPAPHPAEVLNLHARRVACTTCHVTDFARTDATNVDRDWSETLRDEEKAKFTYRSRTEAGVRPAYAWFNGSVYMQLPREKVRRNAAGEIEMAVPQGTRAEPGAKIQAFKLYRATMPVLGGKEWILPITTEEYYRHGDMNRAVREAAEIFYGIHEAEFSWARTIRYQGIFHGVQPSEKALSCLDCHGRNGRLDWKALGYASDPVLARMAAQRSTK
ncbi:MAG: hypothetical protein AB1625_14940 [Acidobacteriota bacterium]